MKPKEVRYYGIHACLAVFRRRPDDILRVYLEESSIKTFKEVLKWCAKNRKPYRIVTKEELEKLTDSVHHEGVAFMAFRKPPVSFSVSRAKGFLLYLDGVQNPHNIGSILRTCAHFGIDTVIGEDLPPLSPSACRISKGASEYVNLISLSRPREEILALKKRGFAFAVTSSHGGESLFGHSFSRNTVLAMGSESTGLSESLFNLATVRLQIPGTGRVESLNVATATALCIGEYCRHYGEGK